MELGKQIKQHRENSGLSQEELAQKIYVSRQTISNWETEKSYPDIHNILLLSVLFNVSLDTLVKGDLEGMKRKIESSKMQRWAWVMTVLLVLTPLSIAPAFKFMGQKGLLIPIVLGIIAVAASFKVEKIKKMNDIQTYSEILAFWEIKDVDKNQIAAERRRLKQTRWLLAALCGLITPVLSYLSCKLFGI